MGYLSDIARRRIAALILIAGIVVAVLAITDTAVFDDPPSEEERVADAVEGFFGAAAEGDFDGYCDQLTEAARDFVRTSAARLIQETEEKLSCPEIVTLAAERFQGLTVKVRMVSVSGNRARAEVALKVPENPSELRTVLLELGEDGSWLVSDQG